MLSHNNAIKDKINYSYNYGMISTNNTFFGEKEINIDLLNCKIINIKIYSGIENKRTIISGLEYTLRNLYNGKSFVKIYKTSRDLKDMKELNINNEEYLNRFYVRFSNTKEYITQLGFYTNKNNGILVGEEEGEVKTVIMNYKNNIILEIHGFIGTNLYSIGCIYSSTEIFIKNLLFRFFMLRHLVKSNKKFWEKWNDNYNNLTTDFKFIWRAVNMPDNIFSRIINNCL